MTALWEHSLSDRSGLIPGHETKGELRFVVPYPASRLLTPLLMIITTHSPLGTRRFLVTTDAVFAALNFDCRQEMHLKCETVAGKFLQWNSVAKFFFQKSWTILTKLVLGADYVLQLRYLPQRDQRIHSNSSRSICRDLSDHPQLMTQNHGQVECHMNYRLHCSVHYRGTQG